MATATVDPTAPLVAMADRFMLKEAKSRHQIQAKQSALGAWIKRVLETNGPTDGKLILAAAEKMGFKDHQVTRARVSAGVVSYADPQGSNTGQGKGQFIRYAALPHQVPEGAVVFGAGRRERASQNGVVAVREDQSLEPTQAAELPAEEPERPLLGLREPLKLEPIPAPLVREPEIPLGLDPNVSAAAQMLLDSLGVKLPGQEARDALREAHAKIRAASGALLVAEQAIIKAGQALEPKQ